MKIGEVANETGLSISNIRFYEKKGLLTPARKEESGYRDYTEEDVHRLKTILLYRKMNLPIETIYLLFQEKIDLKDALQRHTQELEKQKEELEASLGLCQKVLSDEDFAEIDVDNYLEYVHEEESKGRQFIVIQEIVDDFSEYMGFKRYVYGDPMIGMILVMNGMFVFMLPSGVGLYYLTSGMFSAVEQLVYYMIKLKINKKDNYNAA